MKLIILSFLLLFLINCSNKEIDNSNSKQIIINKIYAMNDSQDAIFISDSQRIESLIFNNIKDLAREINTKNSSNVLIELKGNGDLKFYKNIFANYFNENGIDLQKVHFVLLSNISNELEINIVLE